jgi:hypothetical protein
LKQNLKLFPDFLREIQVWQHFNDVETQSDLFSKKWHELLIIGFAQCFSSQSLQLKTVVISTMIDYVKSLMCSTNENQTKLPGQQLKNILNNVWIVNKFIDAVLELQLTQVKTIFN